MGDSLGRGGQWPGVVTKNGAGWKEEPCSLTCAVPHMSWSSAEPWQTTLAKGDCGTSQQQQNRSAPLKGLCLSLSQCCRVTVSGCCLSQTHWGSVCHGKSLGATDGPRDKV